MSDVSNRTAQDGNAIRGLFRDETGLLHIARDGAPACGYVGDVIDTIHPIDRAAMWCSRCMWAVLEATKQIGVTG